MQPPQTTPGVAPSAPAGRGRWIASGIGLALATLAFLTVPRYLDRHARASYKATLRARADDLTRWKGWLETGSCLRRDDSARWLPASDQPTGNAVTAAVAQSPLADPQCMKVLVPLEADPALPADAQAVVHSWLDADRALAEPTATAPDRMRGLLEARDRVRASVRSQLLPAVRAAIHKVEDRHGGKRDYVWWHLELGFQLENVLDLGFQAHHDGRDIAAAIRTPLHHLTDQLREADSLVGVRDIPSLDVLARATGDEAWPALLGVDDNAAWNGLEDDNSVFGPMPSEPEGCAADLQ